MGTREAQFPCTTLTNPAFLQIKKQPHEISSPVNTSETNTRKRSIAPRQCKRCTVKEKLTETITVWRVYRHENILHYIQCDARNYIPPGEIESLQVLTSRVIFHQTYNKTFRETFGISKKLTYSDKSRFLLTKNGSVTLQMEIPKGYFQAEVGGKIILGDALEVPCAHLPYNSEDGDSQHQVTGTDCLQPDFPTEMDDGEDLQVEDTRCMSPISIIVPDDEDESGLREDEQSGSRFARIADEDNRMADEEISESSQDEEPEALTEEMSDMDVNCDYVPAHEVISSISSKRVERIKEGRRFIRLAMSNKAGMLFSKLLNLSISYEPYTRIDPYTPEIIIGVTQNDRDVPVLLPGQRRISPVLVTMPSGVTFNQPLMVRLPLLDDHTPGFRIKVLCSDTEVTEPTQWKPAEDVECYAHQDRKVTMHLRHFSLYCVVEEKIETAPARRPKVVSVYLRNKKFRTRHCVEVSVALTDRVGAAVPPTLGGKLVGQENFRLIESQPVTIRVSANSAEWNVMEPIEQELDEFDINNRTEIPARHSFNVQSLDETSPHIHIVDLQVRLKQAEGREKKLHIYENVEELFGESLPSLCSQESQPMQQITQPARVPESHGSVEGHLPTPRGTAATHTDQPHIHDDDEEQEAHTSRTSSVTSNIPQGHTASNITTSSALDHNDNTTGGSMLGANVAERANLLPALPGVDSNQLAIPSEIQACLQNLTQVCNVSVVNNNYYQETSSQLPPSTTKDWIVKYEYCAKIAAYLDHQDKWKLLASKLKCDNLIEPVAQWAVNKKGSATEMLLREWMLTTGATYEKLIKALKDMDQIQIVHELEDLASSS